MTVAIEAAVAGAGGKELPAEVDLALEHGRECAQEERLAVAVFPEDNVDARRKRVGAILEHANVVPAETTEHEPVGQITVKEFALLTLAAGADVFDVAVGDSLVDLFGRSGPPNVKGNAEDDAARDPEQDSSGQSTYHGEIQNAVYYYPEKS